MSSPDDTGQYDLATYASTVERMEALKLPCFWQVIALREGAILNLSFKGEQERVFIQSPHMVEEKIQSVIEWTAS